MLVRIQRVVDNISFNFTVILFVLNRQMRLEIVGMEDLAAAMDWIFMIIPYYNFAHSLFHINTMNALVNVST